MAIGSKPWRIGVAAGVLVAVAGSTGFAVASIPDSNGVIHACYVKGVGVLRVIDTDAGQHCASFEFPVNWNQTGPQGPAGPTGPAGPSPFAAYADGGNQQPVNCPPNYQPVSWNLSPTAGIADPPLVRSSQFNLGSPTGVIIDVFGDPGTYGLQLLCQLGGTPVYLSGSYVIP
jgi:hypothetical protein